MEHHRDFFTISQGFHDNFIGISPISTILVRCRMLAPQKADQLPGSVWEVAASRREGGTSGCTTELMLQLPWNTSLIDIDMVLNIYRISTMISIMYTVNYHHSIEDTSYIFVSCPIDPIDCCSCLTHFFSKSPSF